MAPERPATSLYRFEQPVRSTSLLFILGFAAIWFIVFGYGLIIYRQPFTLTSASGTVVFLLIPMIIFLTYLFKGGIWSIQITDEALCWHGPFQGDTMIRHEDVESFEVVIFSGEPGASPRTQAYLKSGEKVVVPGIGDNQRVHRLLLTKWKYRGTRTD